MKLYTVITPGTKIIYRRGGIYIVKKTGEETLVPPDTECIVIASSRVGVSSKAVRAAVERGIDIVFLNFNGAPVARVYPPYISKTVSTRIQQYTILQKEYGRKLAKEIAYTKIANQAELLKYLAKNYRDPSLRESGYEVDGIATELRIADHRLLDSESILSFESRAARVYWQTVASLVPQELGFRGRDHNSRDPFNMALNYGYGILYGVCEKALLLSGLDPYLGVLHTPKSGKPSLTLDFIEMFRPLAADKPLILSARKIEFNLSGDKLDYETRKIVAGVVLENLKQKYMYSKMGRREELSEIVKREAWDLAHCIREGVEYRGFRAVL